MKPEIKAAYSPAILTETLNRYQCTKEDIIKDLEGFESHVFEVEYQGTSCILKITHTFRRSIDYLMAEIEWLNHLSSHHVPIAQAIQSPQGEWVEAIAIENSPEFFLAMMYQKLPGKEIETEDITPEILKQLGQHLGHMHQLTKNFQPSKPERTRQQWHIEDLYKLELWIPAEQTELLKAGNALLEKIKSKNKSTENYGLVHSDLHHGNFHWDGQKVYLFDFDDSEYHWFMNDIALVFYYYIYDMEEKDRPQFIEDFLQYFVTAYTKENTLKATEWDWFHTFLQLRDLLLTTLVYQTWGSDLKPKRKESLKRRADRIISGETGINIHFTEN